MIPILSQRELRALATEPLPDPGDVPCLAIDLSSADDANDTPALVAWLAAQPLVVIGVGPENPSRPLAAGIDLTTGADGLEVCVDAVARHPTAAVVLAQVLRLTASLPLHAALVVESLAYATLQAGPEHRAWLEAERRDRPARALPERADIVLLERAADVLRITLNSPETRNALSVPMRDALADAFALVAMDDSIAAAEVTATGPCFSAGGDLREFGLVPDPATAHRIRMQRMPATQLVRRSGAYRFRLHGACIGAGIELPAFAGRVTVAKGTWFRLPEVGMGLIPGAGGCVSIPRRIGRQRTARMALTGEDVTAEQALDWGLVDALED